MWALLFFATACLLDMDKTDLGFGLGMHFQLAIMADEVASGQVRIYPILKISWPMGPAPENSYLPTVKLTGPLTFSNPEWVPFC